jgi:PAS domain-containing protein
MAQLPVEVILMRQLASYLATPILGIDPDCNLLFFNEPAEPILGRRFDETGLIPLAEWSAVFRVSDERGAPIAPDDLPIVIAARRGEQSHRRTWLRGSDGVGRPIESTCFPILGQSGRILGGVAIFWEVRHS